VPGALVYTDDALNIIFCNDRFKEMYPVPSELLQSGRLYPAFLRYLAEHGYYGEGEIDALVARSVESLRNPSGCSFFAWVCYSYRSWLSCLALARHWAHSPRKPSGLTTHSGGRGRRSGSRSSLCATGALRIM
jgi:PAS domain-containing protein